MLGSDRLPIGVEMKFPVAVTKPVEEMTGLEAGPAIEPYALLERFRARQPADAQCVLDDLERSHLEPGMTRAEPLGEGADHVVVRAALGIGLHDRAADLQIGVSARGVEIVVFEKGGRRQNDISHRRGLGQELLVHANEQVVATEALAHQPGLRRNDQRISVLNEQGGDQRAVAEVPSVAGKDGANAGLVESAGR